MSVKHQLMQHEILIWQVFILGLWLGYGYVGVKIAASRSVNLKHFAIS